MSFENLGLSEKTIKAIMEKGLEKPTTVQADVIPSILQGKDVFTIAPQKCGKTTSYVFPLVDIISKHNKQNILIITPSSDESVVVSDRLSVFNKYHEINEVTVKDGEEDIDNEANVIIASPDLLLEIVEEGKVDLSNINILVVDDINLIKRNKQLENLEKILAMLPAEKQNIVYTNRRSRETQDILDKILKAPEEIKIAATKEQEAEEAKPVQAREDRRDNRRDRDRTRKDRRDRDGRGKKEEARVQQKFNVAGADEELVELAKKYNSFNGKTPNFILSKSLVADNED